MTTRWMWYDFKIIVLKFNIKDEKKILTNIHQKNQQKVQVFIQAEYYALREMLDYN
mgnify:CR=1 FL=1